MKSILQRDYKDCGVTCLEYIIEFYRGHVPIEKLREDTFTNQSGTTAYHLVETLKKYQFDSYGEKSDIDHLGEIPLPAILHFVLSNGMQHFVVLTKVNENHVIIMDPNSGKRTILKKELKSIWDGVVLVAIPRYFIPRIPKQKNIFLHLFEILKKEKKFILKIVFLSILVSILTIFSSLYIKIGMEYITFLSWNEMMPIVVTFAFFTIFKIVFTFQKENLKIYLKQNIDVTYLYSFMSHFLKIPLQKFETFQEGDILTRIDEAQEMKNLFISTCITFFMEGTLALFSIIFLFLIDYHLTIVIVICMLFYVVFGLISSKFYYHIVIKIMESTKNWNHSIIENIKMFPTMKHLNNTKEMIEDMESVLCEHISVETKETRKAFLIEFVRENCLEILFFVIVTYGIYLIGNQTITIYDFLVFQSLYLYFVSPLKELTNIGPKFYYMKGVITKLSEWINLKEEELITQVPIPVPTIEVKNITYSYNDIIEIISNLSFKIKAKEHVFLEGSSGCGKSTLCKILHKEIADYMGTITFQGKDLEDYSLSEIRASVMYLSQKEHLKSGTIEENILLGSEKNKKFDLVCEACEIEDIVANKPLRYESFINDSTLSGGEKQRILLARTLLKEGSIYILDECLSEVEEKLEIKIIKEIRKFLKGKTLIYISHRDHHDLFERSIHFENKKHLS